MKYVVNPKSVLICGDYYLPTLSEDAKNRIKSAMDNDLNIIVGDNDGIDLLIQHYLHYNNYRNVTVFTRYQYPVINIGKWPQHTVYNPDNRIDPYAFYKFTLCNACNFAIVIGDERSPEVFNPCATLKSQNKFFYYYKN